MTQKPYKAGIDAGNISAKVVTDKVKFLIPSCYSYYLGETAYSEVQSVPLEELHNNIDITLFSEATKLLNGQRIIVGKKVLEDQMRPVEMESKSDKSTDEIPVVLILSGLAVDAIQRNPDKTEINIEYDLATSLPVSTITLEKANNHSKRLTGNHKVTFHLPDKEVTINIRIVFATTLPEGAAGAWGFVFNKDGKEKERKIEVNNKIEKVKFTERKMLSFDIGGGTTERAITVGVSFKPRLSDGLTYGVKDTVLETLKVWNRLNPTRTIDGLSDFDDIYQNSEHPRHNEVYNFFKPGLLQLSDKLAQEIINKIDEVKDIDFIYIYGGGSIIIRSLLKERLEAKGRLEKVVFAEDPVFVNADGLFVYCCSPRFEQKKEEFLTKVN
ncbi:ParM/StbA family protein [Paenibacillus larvae]|uniref:PRTRC system protein D n=1 Tax=Paenibacillus larvae subsp. larvae TaxID=147375 RepID=A0A6C0QZM4_9BACL|nr:ParM/StbA family protein [Paenibacillus larvae]QHZ54174.1 PRTRC system protein D [Paenibacillus larvae subsp. larvae]